MAWKRPTLRELIERVENDMKSRLTNNTSILYVSILKILARVIAGASHLILGLLENLLTYLMPDTTDAEFIDRFAYIYGVEKIPASFSSGVVVFTGENAFEIPSGTELYFGGAEYETTEDKTIVNGFALVPIQAIETGDSFNLSSAENLSMTDPNENIDEIIHTGIYDLYYDTLSGGTFTIGDIITNSSRDGIGHIIDTAVNYLQIIILTGEFLDNDEFESGSVSAVVDGTAINKNVISGGADEEGTESLRNRLLQRIQEQPAGGAVHDYKRWAMEVTGVGAAWVYPITPSIGSVTIIIKAMGSEPVPSTALLSSVSDYLAERKPVSAVNVVAPIVASIIDMTISITPNSTTIQQAIIANVQQFFQTIGAPNEAVLNSQLRNAISTTGINNFLITSLLKDSSSISVTSDIAMTNYQYPILGTITFNSL